MANTLWIIGYYQAVWTTNNYKEQKIAEFEQSHAQLLQYAQMFLPTMLQQLWSRSSWSLEPHGILPQKWQKLCYFGIDLQNIIWKIYILSFSIFWLVKGVLTLLFLTEYFNFSAIFDSSMPGFKKHFVIADPCWVSYNIHNNDKIWMVSSVGHVYNLSNSGIFLNSINALSSEAS